MLEISYKKFRGNSLMAQQAKTPALSLSWLWLQLWLWVLSLAQELLHASSAAKKKKKKKVYMVNHSSCCTEVNNQGTLTECRFGLQTCKS